MYQNPGRRWETDRNADLCASLRPLCGEEHNEADRVSDLRADKLYFTSGNLQSLLAATPLISNFAKYDASFEHKYLLCGILKKGEADEIRANMKCFDRIDKEIPMVRTVG